MCNKGSQMARVSVIRAFVRSVVRGLYRIDKLPAKSSRLIWAKFAHLAISTGNEYGIVVEHSG